jgi:hypothetical protein
MIKTVLLCLVFLALLGWGTLAAVFSKLPPRARWLLAAAYALAQLLSVSLPGGAAHKALWSLGTFALLLAWWLRLEASNEGDWCPDVAVLPGAEVNGDLVTVRNIRNNEYRTAADYTVRHYDKTYDLADLCTLDLFLGYWGMEHIAHTMLSFGFKDGAQLCFSIETRKQKGEVYSSVRGFFKQYELTYVAADERDVIRLRTDYRTGEDMYLFRLAATPRMIRAIFLEYVGAMNRIREKPQWYNAATANCTTSIWKHVVPHYPKLKIDWRLLFSGYSDRMVYDLGLMGRAMSFEELKRRSWINPASKAAGASPDYSALIRRGLPGFPPG